MPVGSMRPPMSLSARAEEEAQCRACALPVPPTGGLWDRLAALFERRAPNRPVGEMLSLATVLAPQDLQELSPRIVRFYAEPQAHRVHASVRGSRWSLFLLWTFALFARQCLIPGWTRNPTSYAVSQWLYTDRDGHVHWDRYACVDGRCARLFVARMQGLEGHVRETFIVYGLRVALTFSASVVERGLVLRMTRRLSSKLAWIAKVQYHTEEWQQGLRTRGDFSVPALGMHVQTEFWTKPR